MKRILAIVLVALSIAAGALGATASQLPQLAGASLNRQSLAEDIQKPGHGSFALTRSLISQSLAEDIQKPGHSSFA